MTFKIKGKFKDSLVGTYFKIDGRYYKIHAFDKKANYLHMVGDEFNKNDVGEHFGTTLDGWRRKVQEGKYTVVPESEVPDRVLDYKLKKSYEF